MLQNTQPKEEEEEEVLQEQGNAKKERGNEIYKELLGAFTKHERGNLQNLQEAVIV